MTTLISKSFTQLRATGRMAFMPFIAAGDPDMALTGSLLEELAGRGVDLIEVGFPYSDPIADGPVIQSSYTRALQAKLRVEDIFRGVGDVRGRVTCPLVAMVSYAIVFRSGVGPFLDRAREAGFAGLIVPDLPGDEAAELFEQVRARGMDLVQLVAPTTPRDRVREILKSCSGFVYCIAVAGTTGERAEIASELTEQLRWLREETSLPLCVGFGISKPEHLEPLRGPADGAIVGSGIVRMLQDLADGKRGRAETVTAVGEFAQRMVDAAHAG